MARISLVPQNKQFFRLLEQASDNAVGISRQLVQLLDAFPSNGTNLREIKELEHEGDRLTREVVDLTCVPPRVERQLPPLSIGRDQGERRRRAWPGVDR